MLEEAGFSEVVEDVFELSVAEPRKPYLESTEALLLVHLMMRLIGVLEAHSTSEELAGTKASSHDSKDCGYLALHDGSDAGSRD